MSTIKIRKNQTVIIFHPEQSILTFNGLIGKVVVHHKNNYIVKTELDIQYGPFPARFLIPYNRLTNKEKIAWDLIRARISNCISYHQFLNPIWERVWQS